jgi:hypothetical protein
MGYWPWNCFDMICVDSGEGILEYSSVNGDSIRVYQSGSGWSDSGEKDEVWTIAESS